MDNRDSNNDIAYFDMDKGLAVDIHHIEYIDPSNLEELQPMCLKLRNLELVSDSEGESSPSEDEISSPSEDDESSDSDDDESSESDDDSSDSDDEESGQSEDDESSEWDDDEDDQPPEKKLCAE